ncbi:MAG TPA: hypothetical protein DCY93_00865 [Firmicutes bacterium]|nr:hypothetical protein [Bacillota bacterium]
MKTPLIISAVLLTLGCSSIQPKSSKTLLQPGVKKNAITQIPIEEDTDREYVCYSINDSINHGTKTIMDEWLFDHVNPGKTSTFANINKWITKDTVFTLGVRLKEDSIKTVLNKEITISGSMRIQPNGAPTIIETKTKTLTVVDHMKSSLGTLVKEVNYSYGAFYLTFQASVDGYINSLSFTFGTAATYFDKIQVSAGNYVQFPGFTDYYSAPCDIPTTRVESDSVYLDVDFDNKYDVVTTLVNSNIAYDEEDGVYYHPTLVKDEYTINKNNINEFYPVVISAKDQANNVSTLTYYLRTVDRIGPKIVKKNNDDIVFSYRDLTKENILNLYNISDNNQIKTKEILDFDIAAAKKAVGDYTFTIKATDMSDNITTKEASLKVIDDVAPTLNVPIQINTTVSRHLSSEDLINLVNAQDEIDGEIIPTVECSAYEKNYNKVGIYKISFNAKDKSNNNVTRTVNVIVSDDKAPIFFVYEQNIRIYVGDKVDVLNVINTMADNGIISKGKYVNYQVIGGDDISNKLAEGSYKTKVLATTEDGKSVMVNLKIDVTKQVKTKKSFWQKFIDFFKNIFNSIGNFFKKLFHR